MSVESVANIMMDPAEMAAVQRQVEVYNADLKARGIVGERDMGQDKYLKLLVTQLRYQDPQNPMQNHEFASQMAQFSSLEQMTKMNSNMEKSISSARLSESYAMLGKEVSWYNADTRELASGVVKAIILGDGHPMLRVGNTDVDMAAITGVRMPPPQEVSADTMRSSRAYETMARRVPGAEDADTSAEDAVDETF
ncbi:MAG: flagellar hook assembly protein FlgD [Spirochaetota bacterium]|jgi:flagellar basal-body rod modification protein FlgD|nr:flagellar hook assembly protein FlgD [Spirochaetota bacterium]